MSLQFVHSLKREDPLKFEALLKEAKCWYWSGKTPEDSTMKILVEYVEHLEDEANREYDNYIIEENFKTFL